MRLDIGGRPIGPEVPLFVIAEIGLNHGGSLDRALALVDAAAAAGASAVKLQTFCADRLLAPSGPAPAHLAPSSTLELFRALELDEGAHRAIARQARSRGLAFLSTPFDETSVELLERVGCDAYKISSGDLTHLRLIRRAARTGKPLVISTGMGEMPEIAAAVEAARAAGADTVALLHCVSAYPVPAGGQNLRALQTLARAFDLPVGLSDHGQDRVDLAVAVALGAVLYEKHLMADGDDGAVDAAVSATPAGLSALVELADRTRRTLGDGRKTCLPIEVVNRTASRRGLYAARHLRAGELVDGKALIALRPAVGLDVRAWPTVMGQRVIRDIRAGAPLLESDLAAADRRLGCVA